MMHGAPKKKQFHFSGAGTKLGPRTIEAETEAEAREILQKEIEEAEAAI